MSFLVVGQLLLCPKWLHFVRMRPSSPPDYSPPPMAGKRMCKPTQSGNSISTLRELCVVGYPAELFMAVTSLTTNLVL